MSNIKEFKDNNKLEKYISNLSIKTIGKGTEGYVSLTKDNDTIKYIDNIERKPYTSTIITKDDLNLESFAFPTEIFVVNEFVAGYRAEYFENDIFNCMNYKTGITFDLRNLYKARLKMIKDIEVLSKNKYKMSDIANNLLFNGEKLMAIDTLSYHKVKNLYAYDNIEEFDYAIKYRLCLIDQKAVRWNDLSGDEVIKKIAQANRSYQLTIPAFGSKK